jgi:L-2-hydroxyglutarate oxidase
MSHDLWRRFAEKKGIAWKPVRTIEIALDDTQHKILEKYLKWGVQNGISEKDLELLDRNEITKKEPNISCHSSIFCKTDVAVFFGKLTQELKNESEKNGTNFLLNHKVESIENKKKPIITFENKTQLSCDFVINCAGGYSLDIAKKFDVALQYSSLHFRGEYWIAQKEYANLVKTNVYSVPNYPDFPFLDPHWILRADGRSEVGPNAVPVPSPETYSGYVGNMETFISKLVDVVTGNARNLLLNTDFMNLIAKEWISSISKVVMIERMQKFIPKIKPEQFLERGTAGIRTPIITPEGKFLPDVIELEGTNSYHILNYNSPGATGAPAYSAYVVKSLQEKGLLNYTKHTKESIWDFDKIM